MCIFFCISPPLKIAGAGSSASGGGLSYDKITAFLRHEVKYRGLAYAYQETHHPAEPFYVAEFRRHKIGEKPLEFPQVERVYFRGEHLLDVNLIRESFGEVAFFGVYVKQYVLCHYVFYAVAYFFGYEPYDGDFVYVLEPSVYYVPYAFFDFVLPVYPFERGRDVRGREKFGLDRLGDASGDFLSSFRDDALHVQSEEINRVMRAEEQLYGYPVGEPSDERSR